MISVDSIIMDLVWIVKAFVKNGLMFVQKAQEENLNHCFIEIEKVMN